MAPLDGMDQDLRLAVRRTRAFGIARVALRLADLEGLEGGAYGPARDDVYDDQAILLVARLRLWMGDEEVALALAGVWTDSFCHQPDPQAARRVAHEVRVRWRSQPEPARARDVALVAHAGVVDKAGKPYIEHPARVAQAVQGDDAKAVAWLHDVVEDTPITLDDLRLGGFSGRVVRGVDAMTHREWEEYLSFVRRAALDPVARQVKLADVRDNMDLGRLAGQGPEALEAGRRRIREKYEPALRVLKGEDE